MPGGHEMTPTPMETTQDTGSDAGRFDEPGIPSNAPRMLVRVFFSRQGARPFWQCSEKGPRQDQGARILHMAPVRLSIRSGSILRRFLDKTKGQGFCIWQTRAVTKNLTKKNKSQYSIGSNAVGDSNLRERKNSTFRPSGRLV